MHSGEYVTTTLEQTARFKLLRPKHMPPLDSPRVAAFLIVDDTYEVAFTRSTTGMLRPFSASIVDRPNDELDVEELDIPGAALSFAEEILDTPIAPDNRHSTQPRPVTVAN